MSPEHRAPQAGVEVILHPTAEPICWKLQAEDIVVHTERTIGDSVLTTTSVRRVAEAANDAGASVYVKSNAPYRLSL